MERYYTNYSNEVHQLIITPSRHFYVTTDGRFKYQSKPFDVTLKNCGTRIKKSIIHYLIRDHFSGVFYWEISKAENPIPIQDFLFRAWSRKEKKEFQGIPEYITIPKIVQSFFPGLIKFIEKIGIKYLAVTSGFQGGVRDIKTIEGSLKIIGYYINPQLDLADPQFGSVMDYIPTLREQLVGRFYNAPSKTDKWVSGINSNKKLLVPESLRQFESLYQDNRG